jgi:hypothetical protein
MTKRADRVTDQFIKWARPLLLFGHGHHRGIGTGRPGLNKLNTTRRCVPDTDTSRSSHDLLTNRT